MFAPSIAKRFFRLFLSAYFAIIGKRACQIQAGGNQAAYAHKAGKKLCCDHVLLSVPVRVPQSYLKTQ